MKLIDAMKNMNIELLLGSKKDLDLLSGVYGKEILKRKKTAKKVVRRNSTKKTKATRQNSRARA
jgi:hypothetical protein